MKNSRIAVRFTKSSVLAYAQVMETAGIAEDLSDVAPTVCLPLIPVRAEAEDAFDERGWNPNTISIRLINRFDLSIELADAIAKAIIERTTVKVEFVWTP